ncbi:AAC(3) family N-acetyltransferase [Oscillospiraceae bacterium 38-13]
MELDYKGMIQMLDIAEGDVIDVVSDLISVSAYCKKRGLDFDPDKLIDTLIEQVGSNGTILIRTFTWDYCRGKTFDIRHSPGKVGVLGNVAMRRGDFQRTKHPLYSWMVWGAQQSELCAMENKSSFGKNTPFDFLSRSDAKQVTIGNCSTVGCTQIHHCEAMAEVPYRAEKVFEGTYIDAEGQVFQRRYSMFVRPLNLDVSHSVIEYPLFTQRMKEAGILRMARYDGMLDLKTYSLRMMTEYMIHHLRDEDGSLMVSINGLPGYKAANVDWSGLRF